MEVAIFIILLILIVLLLIYNGLIKKRNAVKQSRSSIDVYLNQRFDLIPNLVECVKGYAKHESNLIESITKLRSEYNQNKDLSTASQLNTKVNNLLVEVENYPELKSSENFLNLQKNLTKMEDQLQAARRLYNSNISILNQLIVTFPASMVANSKGLTKKDFFEAENHKKEDVKIDL